AAAADERLRLRAQEERPVLDAMVEIVRALLREPLVDLRRIERTAEKARHRRVAPQAMRERAVTLIPPRERESEGPQMERAPDLHDGGAYQATAPEPAYFEPTSVRMAAASGAVGMRRRYASKCMRAQAASPRSRQT